MRKPENTKHHRGAHTRSEQTLFLVNESEALVQPFGWIPGNHAQGEGLRPTLTGTSLTPLKETSADALASHFRKHRHHFDVAFPLSQDVERIHRAISLRTVV